MNGQRAKRRAAPPAVNPARAREPAAIGWIIVAAAVLVALNLIAFGAVRYYDFVQLDDPVQVSENAHVAGGLTAQTVSWAFTDAYAGYWMPLVWLSHMADVQAYGMNAGPHHVTNLLLHILNTLLIGAVLWRMTGAVWRAAFAAALFAVHPLHVESVAWITERKDVLSTFFWLLAIWAYIAYVRKPGVVRYVMVAFAMALGLMAKPMLVTLPLTLLLLDVWPLRRVAEAGLKPRPGAASRIAASARTWSQLFLEKVPLFALAAAAGIVAFLTQRGAGAVSGLEAYPLGLRLQNAIVSYVAYLGKMLWPVRLVPFYPYPSSLPSWSVAASLVLLAAISIVAVRARHRFPYLLVGWLWYVGTLIPVIGLVQVGLQSMADRFTYVPLIGIFVAAAWGLGDLVPGAGTKKAVAAAAAAVVIVACTLAARTQVTYWKDSVAMWTRTTEVALDTDAYHAHMALGTTLRGQGRIAEALGHFREAARLQPASPEPRFNLGETLASQGRNEEAIAEFAEAVRLRPDYADAHVALALLLSGRPGAAAEAIAHYTQALRVKPDLAEVRNNLGSLLAEQGKIDESIEQFTQAARLKPDLEVAHVNLGIALVKADRIEEAVREFREALRLNPNNELARRAVAGLTGK